MRLVCNGSGCTGEGRRPDSRRSQGPARELGVSLGAEEQPVGGPLAEGSAGGTPSPGMAAGLMTSAVPPAPESPGSVTEAQKGPKPHHRQKHVLSLVTDQGSKMCPESQTPVLFVKVSEWPGAIS